MEVIRAEIQPVMYKEWNLNDIVFIIVKALQDISRIRFYGITVLCDVLRGSDHKKISDNNLDKLPEYGKLKELSFEEIKTIIEWMISEHYILQTKGKYPVIHSTYEGLHYSESITENKLKKLRDQL